MPRDLLTDRRAMLGRLATGAAVAAMPAAALAGEPDPHLAWFAEWKTLLAWCNTPGVTGGRDLAEFSQWHRVEELEDLIEETPATSMAGACAQLALVHYMLTEVGSHNEDDVTALQNALATLERLAGGAA
jgi:hypothetical protein